jgi:uncharacterized protein YjbJ (UPF0337 family)
MDDRIENAAERAKGKLKEGVGSATGNESMKREGEFEQAKAGLKDTGEDIKDSLTRDRDRDDDVPLDRDRQAPYTD